MSACQSAAKQANDALAYARSVGAGSCGCACGGSCESSAAGSCTCADEGGASKRTGGTAGWASRPAGIGKRAEKRKSGCKRQGPGCSNAACNAAADQAIAVIDAVADLPEGLPRVTMGQIRLARFAGGFKPPARRSAPPPPDMSRSSAGVPSRVTTDCSGCDTGGADEFCGSNPDAPNSKYAYSVGPWTPMLYGGCQREVGCVDYAGSCPDDSGATGMGDECDAKYGLNVCNPTFNRWVFIPNVSEGVATGGSCGAVWTCVKGLVPDVETCGEAGPTPYPAARVSVVANVSEPRTQYCDGVQTSVDDSWRDVDWRAHGIDDETAPDVSASIWSTLPLWALGATSVAWAKGRQIQGQGCVMNNSPWVVSVFNDQSHCFTVPALSSTRCVADSSGVDVDFIRAPNGRRWYKITYPWYLKLNPFPTAVVQPDGTVVGDVELIDDSAHPGLRACP